MFEKLKQNWKDHRCLQKLRKRLAKTGAGVALLDFARQKKIKIRFEDFPADSVVVAQLQTVIRATYKKEGRLYKGALVLNRQRTEENYIGSIAHELFHAFQKEQLGNNFLSECLPPPVVLLSERFLEASAYTFEEKFLHDYAEKTGDAKPRNVFYEGAETAPAPKGDKANFINFCKILEGRLHYNSKSMEQSTSFLRAYAKDSNLHFLQPRVAFKNSSKILMGIVSKIDTTWVLPPSEGENVHYLSDVDKRELVDTFSLPKNLVDEFRGLCAAYQVVHDEYLKKKRQRAAEKGYLPR